MLSRGGNLENNPELPTDDVEPRTRSRTLAQVEPVSQLALKYYVTTCNEKGVEVWARHEILMKQDKALDVNAEGIKDLNKLSQCLPAILNKLAQISPSRAKSWRR